MRIDGAKSEFLGQSFSYSQACKSQVSMLAFPTSVAYRPAAQPNKGSSKGETRGVIQAIELSGCKLGQSSQAASYVIVGEVLCLS